MRDLIVKHIGLLESQSTSTRHQIAAYCERDLSQMYGPSGGGGGDFGGGGRGGFGGRGDGGGRGRGGGDRQFTVISVKSDYAIATARVVLAFNLMHLICDLMLCLTASRVNVGWSESETPTD